MIAASRRILALGGIALLCLLGLSLISTQRAQAGYWRHCGDQKQMGAGWYNVRAHNISCGKARGLAYTYVWTENSLRGFSCNQYDVGYELSRVACQRIRGNVVQKVRFQFGA